MCFFLSLSLRTSLCVQYSPSIICVAAIRLAMLHLMRMKKLDREPVRTLAWSEGGAAAAAAVAPQMPNTRPWYEELFGLSTATIECR